DLQVETGTRIGKQVIMDEDATVGVSSELEDRSVIRHSARLGDQVTLGKSAEIQAEAVIGDGSSVGSRSRLQGRFGDELEVGRRGRLIGGATWGESVEVGDGVKVQVDERSRFADDTNLGESAMITGAIVTGERSMGEGAVIKGGKLPVTLAVEVAVGADAQLVGAVHICDEVEVGESAQIEGPEEAFPTRSPQSST